MSKRPKTLPIPTVGEIVLGNRNVTADTDLRLTRYFRLSEGYFLRLQLQHDIRIERRALGKKLVRLFRGQRKDLEMGSVPFVMAA